MRKVIISIVLTSLAVLMFIIPSKIPVIDVKTEHFMNNTLKETLLSYAAVRFINGMVSVIKHSSMDVEPAGIGLTIGAGEILDPLDDLTERVSDVLFIALVSQGVMNVIYQISQPLFNILIGIILLLFVFCMLMPKYQKTVFNTVKLLLIIASVRLIFPLAAFSEYYTNSFFQTQINTVSNNLKILTYNQNKKEIFDIPQSDGFLSSLKASTKLVAEKISEIKKNFLEISSNLEKIINNLIELAYLYVAMFLINIIIIPLFLFWILKKIFSGIKYELK